MTDIDKMETAGLDVPKYQPKPLPEVKTIPQKDVDAQAEKVRIEGAVASGLTDKETIDAQAVDFAKTHPWASWIQKNWIKLSMAGAGAGLIAYLTKC